jgi:SAM-dependent methyltransferase
VVVSQFGHMFAPRPAVAIAEMLRVLKPGGTIAFSTWPPELFTGRMFKLVSSYLPPPPPGVAPPPQWGDENVVRERLGSAVKDVAFQREVLRAPALSPQHYRALTEKTAGPLVKLVEGLSASDPAKLAAFRKDFDVLCREFFAENFMHQEFLMTRATKN